MEVGHVKTERPTERSRRGGDQGIRLDWRAFEVQKKKAKGRKIDVRMKDDRIGKRLGGSKGVDKKLVVP